MQQIDKELKIFKTENNFFILLSLKKIDIALSDVICFVYFNFSAPHMLKCSFLVRNEAVIMMILK